MKKQSTIEKVILQSIADQIVFDKITDGLHTILNSFSPNDTPIGVQFSGMNNAFDLLQIDDRVMRDEMANMITEVIYEPEDTRTAMELAGVVYFKWLSYIKDCFVKAS